MVVTIIRSALAIVVGFILGSIVNMGIVIFGGILVPPPEGVDVMDVESIKASMHLYEAKHFVVPFLAHALGALVGAIGAFFIAGCRRAIHAYVIGGLFLVGGIAASMMMPAPGWFVALDLIVAYIPMAWLATKIGGRFADAGSATAG